MAREGSIGWRCTASARFHIRCTLWPCAGIRDRERAYGVDEGTKAAADLLRHVDDLCIKVHAVAGSALPQTAATCCLQFSKLKLTVACERLHVRSCRLLRENVRCSCWDQLTLRQLAAPTHPSERSSLARLMRSSFDS
jgi:hypothetical protein